MVIFLIIQQSIFFQSHEIIVALYIAKLLFAVILHVNVVGLRVPTCPALSYCRSDHTITRWVDAENAGRENDGPSNEA